MCARVESLITLPIELRQEIFFRIHDTRDLKAVALSCRSLQLAYNNAKRLIDNRVLRNEVALDILPELFATLCSGELQDRSYPSVERFLDKHFNTRLSLATQFESRDVFALAQFNRIVTHYALDLCRKAFHQLPGDLTDRPAPPSNSEITRIKRAIATFQLYCNLFPGYPGSDKERPLDRVASIDLTLQRDIFFSRFSAWENEQLACVYDYMARMIMPSFNDVAEHDVAWGGVYIPYGENLGDGFLQHVVSLGLLNIFDIYVAKDYAARHQVFCRVYRSKYPSQNTEHLWEGLRCANTGEICHVRLHSFTPEDEARHIRPSFYNDPDPGPEKAWRWAHQVSWKIDFINGWQCEEERRWGYVMWDLERLEEWKTLDQPWRLTTLPEAERNARQYRLEIMQASHQRREEIAKRGGQGWWSSKDESKVKWFDLDSLRREERKKPKSLEDAMKMISSLKLPTH